jgi:hypothetical protein
MLRSIALDLQANDHVGALGAVVHAAAAGRGGRRRRIL